MVKKKTAKVKGFVEIRSWDVRKTNRFFIALRSYGHCDEKDRVVLGVECSGKKLIAKPDKPLNLIASILGELIPTMAYSSSAAMKEDLQKFQEWVATLQVSEGTNQ